MSERRQPLIVTIALLLLALVSCSLASGPTISSVLGEPAVAKEGGSVSHSIHYTNPSQETSYSDVVIVVRYDSYLRFQGGASPYPDGVDEGQRELTWKLGELSPGKGGSIRVEFGLAPSIPREVYELVVAAEISGTDAEGKHTSRTGKGTTLIEGHPTPIPTPRPTSTYIPVTSAPAVTVSPRPTSAPTLPLTITTPAIKPEDCLRYDPDTLAIVPEKALGWSLVVGKEGKRLLMLDTEADADDAKVLASRHTALCYIGRDNTRPDHLDYIVQYWTGDSGYTGTVRQVDCLPYDPKALRIVDEGSAGWLLTDGRSRMLMLDDKQDAENALILARQYAQHCFIGRSNKRADRGAYIVGYWE